MCKTSIFAGIMAMVPDFVIFFIISVFFFKQVFANVADFCIFMRILLLTCQWHLFFPFKFNSLQCACSLRYSQNFSHNLLLYIHHECFLYHQMSIWQTLNAPRDYVYLLLLWIIFQNYLKK